MKLYLSRHGQTDWNVKGLIQGRIDNELNETGRVQARELAKKLKGITFQAIYVSPLSRAQETAGLATGMTPDYFITDPRLIEMEFGDMQGMSYKEIQGLPLEQLNDEQKNVGAYFLYPELYRAPANAETYEDLIERARDFLDDIRGKYNEDENVLIVAHAAFLHAVYLVINHLELHDFWTMKLDNASYKVVEL